MTVLLAVLACLPLAPHVNSLSRTSVAVREARLTLELRCQVLSLLEVIAGLDADGDGAVSAAELARREDEIRAYVQEHYELRVGTDEVRPAVERFTLTLVPPGEDALGWVYGAVDIAAELRASETVDVVTLASTLFLATSPDHVDVTAVTWEDGAVTRFALSSEEPGGRALRPGTEPRADYLRLGLETSWRRWELAALFVALVLGCRGALVRSALALVCAAAVAVGFGLATWRADDLARTAAILAAAAALSVAYVAVDDLLHSERSAARWPEAVLLGALAGAALAAIPTEPPRPLEAIAFLLGTLAPALAAAFALATGGAALAARLGTHGPVWPRRSRRAVAALLTLLGLAGFWTRL